MKSLILILAALLVCVSFAPAYAGGHCQVQAQAFAVAAPVYVQQQFAVPVYQQQVVVQQAVPVYQQQFVQAQAFAAAPYVMQQRAFAQAQAGGRSFAQAQSGGGGGRSFAFSRVGAPAPIRNGLAILGAAIAARRSSQVSIAISR